jgi:hypothetical protein
MRINHVWPHICVISFRWNCHSYHIYASGCTLSRSLWIAVWARLDMWHHLLYPVALTWCLSVVISIHLQHWPSRLIALQYGWSVFILVIHSVNIPLSAYSWTRSLESFDSITILSLPAMILVSVLHHYWLAVLSAVCHNAIWRLSWDAVR